MKTAQVLIRTSAEMRDILNQLAKRENRTVSNYIETLILREYARYKEELAA